MTTPQEVPIDFGEERGLERIHPNAYRCGHCGYEGPCYGTPTGNGVSAPWCKRCQRNDKLEATNGVQQPDGSQP